MGYLGNWVFSYIGEYFGTRGGPVPPVPPEPGDFMADDYLRGPDQENRGVSAIFDPRDLSAVACVFKRVVVVTQPLGGSLIAWELASGFNAKGPFHFFVDFGRGDDWEALNTVPVIDDCVMIDPQQRYWDHLADFYYRIRLNLPNVRSDPNDPNSPCVSLRSQPQQANGVWSKRDWLTGREIMRKEQLMQRKRTNVSFVGYVLRRRRFGELCHVCQEYDTKEIENSRCPVCWGTGFIGGYFRSIPVMITMDASWHRNFKTDPQVSLRNDIVKHGRTISYPHANTKDIFVCKDRGERYVIREIHTLAEVGSVPVVTGVELRLAPTTSIIYDIPLEGMPSSSSSQSSQSSPSSPSTSSSSIPIPPIRICDWRVGKKDDPGW